ncbi:MAG: hypothetical protein EOO90_06250 [Pedobacter sp.]|nr:MAG: hypothetical protein EOO90_06250 [Pedobacter sp.]
MLKTTIYMVFTIMISLGGFITARNSENPWLGFIIAFGIVTWFFWNMNQRWKRADERRIRERMLEEYMRRNQTTRKY